MYLAYYVCKKFLNFLFNTLAKANVLALASVLNKKLDVGLA